MTDNARELVKVFDGDKFVFKKFKNAKFDIIDRVSGNIFGIIGRYRAGNYKKSADIDNKIDINSLSIRIIRGEELIVTDSDEEDEEDEEDKEDDVEIDDESENTKKIKEEEKRVKKEKERKKQKEKEAKKKKYDHLNSKQDGLQKITFEKLKEELYNGKYLFSK